MSEINQKKDPIYLLTKAIEDGDPDASKKNKKLLE